MAVLAARSFLPPRFGLDGPALLDVLAIGLLAYACFEDEFRGG